MQIMAMEGIRGSADDVVVTTGSQQALDLVTRLFVNPGDVVLAESPSYVGALGVFKAYQADVSHVATDAEGLVPEALRETIARVRSEGRTIKFLYTIPNFHNPAGVTLTWARRLEILEICRDAGILVLEDNPYGLLYFDQPAPQAMRSVDDEGVIYLGSFSKTLSLAGERVGYIALNPAMPGVETLAAAVTLTNRTLGYVNAPVIGQRLVAGLLDTTVDLGIYDRRRKLMAEVLTAAGVEFAMPKGAFYFFVKAPGGDDLAFTDALYEERILVVPGRGFGGPGYVRLSCSVDEQIIARSAEGFKRAVAKMKG
jgi:DNA-binding transcriptional MocR family regulator